MTVQLDHILVPSRDMNASAKLLAEILGARWEPSGEGSPMASASTAFVSGNMSETAWQEYRAQRASVYINDSLTLDFINFGSQAAATIGMVAKHDQPVPINHYCFRVSDADFDAIVERIKKAGVKFSSNGLEPDDKINTRLGGRASISWSPMDMDGKY